MNSESAEALEPAERQAFDFLRDHGFHVRPVPRSSALTPEFEVELEGERYLFEVKARRDDEAIGDVQPGEIFSQSQHLFWSQGVLRNVSKAVRQMRQHDPSHERIWIVWLHAEAPIAGDAVEEQIRGTLLGTHAVVDLATMTEDGVLQKDCFYAQEGAFERFPEVDAAVLSVSGGYQMWVNEFTRPERTVNSRLGKLFAEHRGLNVPKEHEEAGRAYRMTTDTSSRTERDVQEHLRSTYGLQMPILLRPQSHRALATLPAAHGDT